MSAMILDMWIRMQYLETRGHISSLLNNVFKLLPSSLGQLEAAFVPLQLEVDKRDQNLLYVQEDLFIFI